MASATVLAIFFVPLTYVLVRRVFPAPIAGARDAPPTSEGEA